VPPPKELPRRRHKRIAFATAAADVIEQLIENKMILAPDSLGAKEPSNLQVAETPLAAGSRQRRPRELRFDRHVDKIAYAHRGTRGGYAISHTEIRAL
jgi:hypothetical protein